MPDPAVQRYVDALAEEVRTGIALMQIALGGLRKYATELAAMPRSPANPHPSIYVGAGPPDTTVPHGRMRLSELTDATRPGGRAEVLLIQQWIVSVYTAWDLKHRDALADLAGVDVSEVRSDVFGDLRLLRNDVVHHSGLATERNAGRCRILVPFARGDVITLTPAQFVTVSDLDVRFP